MADTEQQYNEQQLVANLQKGDQAAFVQFMNRFQTTVFLCCRTLGLNESEAQDAAAETFIAAYDSIRKYRRKSTLATWLWKIAYRKAVDYLRTQKKWQVVKNALPEKPAATPDYDAARTAEQKETTEIVWQKVNELPRLWALAVVLFYREGKTIAQISAIMGLKEETVKTYLFRAKKKLKTALRNILEDSYDSAR